MTSGSIQKILAGLGVVVSSSLLVVLYGNALLSLVHLPIPHLTLNWNMGVSNGFGAYQKNPVLTIQKLGVEAPIVENVSVTNKAVYEEALSEGIASAKGTAGLEASTGNTFLFGHSSNLSLVPSRFDTIFARLPQLEAGDDLAISVAGRTTEYQVVGSRAINPSEVQYLGNTDQRMLTLVTCWPLGTTYKRWVVQATKI